MKELNKIVEELILSRIKDKPRKITLKLYWEKEKSEIKISGEKTEQTFEFSGSIDFTSFANGVLDAYRKTYGELEIVPISFREEIYKNDKVSLDLYPTGSVGLFEIFVEYRERRNGKEIDERITPNRKF